MIINDFFIKLVEQGHIPDALVRHGIRRVCKMRIDEYQSLDIEGRQQRLETFIAELKDSPVALVPDKANEQHYEVPAEFYSYVLGNRRKYSSAYWNISTSTLDQAEEVMLERTCKSAELEDGQQILELGCGWGSLTLWMAEKFPTATITAVSNSNSQREYILSEANKRHMSNVKVITADMNDFSIAEEFDRVVSVEMFEHMRNYQTLMARVANWLKPDGKLFIHIFCHREYAYPYETEGSDNWMGKYFFSGGIMPSVNLMSRFADDLVVERQWNVSGQHYEKTANAWLKNLDQNKVQVLDLFKSCYGPSLAKLWLNRWRVFFMACAELWGYRQGEEWFVTHILFKKRLA